MAENERRKVFLIFLTFTLNLWTVGSVNREDEFGRIKHLNRHSLQREKRFAFLDRLKKKKVLQRFVDDGLSSETEKLSGAYLKTMHFDFIKNEGEIVEFPCNNEVTRAIVRQYPKSTYRWSVNDDPVAMDTSRMSLFKQTFSIRDLKYEDAGVYVCILEYRKGDVKTVGIYPLTVKTEKVTITIRETDDLELSCNSDVFSFNYPGIIIEWFFNETKYDTTTNGNASETLIVEDVETSSEGIWSCIVNDPKSGRVWHSAWYKVAVTLPPPVYEQVYNLMLDYKLYTTLIVLGILLLLAIILAICVFTAQKTKAKNEHKMGAMKDHVMSMQTDNLFGINNLNLEMASESTEADTYSEFDVTTDESSRMMPIY